MKTQKREKEVEREREGKIKAWSCGRRGAGEKQRWDRRREEVEEEEGLAEDEMAGMRNCLKPKKLAPSVKHLSLSLSLSIHQLKELG